jgi:hypothetical protein
MNWQARTLIDVPTTSIDGSQIDKYMKGECITTTKERIESLDIEVDDFMTPTQLSLYIGSSSHKS